MTMTRGRRLLLAVLQLTSEHEVAARCRVNQSCVSRWLTGENTPSESPRAQLAACYRIPVDAWDKRAVPTSAVQHTAAYARAPQHSVTRLRRGDSAKTCGERASETARHLRISTAAN